MSFSNEPSDEAVISEINMTPLVDVMLVLLIIFIITMPVLTQSVSVELPKANAAPAQLSKQRISIMVLKDGSVLWDEQPVSRAQLQLHLAQIAQLTEPPPLQLMADKTVQYQYVMAVMASAQQLGITQLSFVTEPVD